MCLPHTCVIEGDRRSSMGDTLSDMGDTLSDMGVDASEASDGVGGGDSSSIFSSSLCTWTLSMEGSSGLANVTGTLNRSCLGVPKVPAIEPALFSSSSKWPFLGEAAAKVMYL